VLEQTIAEGQRNESRNHLKQLQVEIARLRAQLGLLLNTEEPLETTGELSPIPFEATRDTMDYISNPSLAHMRQRVEVAVREKKLQAARAAPDLLIGFFSQTLIGNASNETGVMATGKDRFTGFEVGIALPLWYPPHHSRVKAADFDRQAAENNFDHHQKSLRAQIAQATGQVNTYRSSLDYYTTSGLLNADRMLHQSQIAFREGEITYAEYLLGVSNAMKIREGYLTTLNDYNQAVIYLEYLTGNPKMK
jgi:cobalt-zinc-cadmium resistance protein CzcA